MNEEHKAELIANLKKEIEADVDGRYAGKTPAELVDLINNNIKGDVGVTRVVDENPIKTIVKEVIDECFVVGGIIIDPNGMVIGTTELQALIDARVAETMKTKEELKDPVTEVTTEYKKIADAPVFRIIMGIPEAPNVVTEEDIINALKK